MAGLIARAHRPVARMIGRRLAAATTPERMRRTIERANALLLPCSGIIVEPTTFAELGGLRVAPKRSASDDRAILMFHGGGYVFGSPRMYRGLAGRVAKAADASVHLPQYRLAPEHAHPAAVHDGLTAYRAMLDRHRAERIVVAGDSAGGGLTVATLQAARDEGLPMPAGMVLLSPWLDLTGGGQSYRANVGTEILILPPVVARAAGWYRGDHPADAPGVSPLFGELAGLPPALVQVSASELLYSDSESFASAARAVGVDVDLRVEADLWHVWQLMAPVVPEARASIAQIGRFVAERTSR